MEDIYLLHFDENDQPYLCHAEGGGWKQHKYLKRIDNALGPGKHLYLYTQREIDAWERRGRRTLSNRIRDRLGFDERDAMIDARRAYTSDHASTGTQGRNYENYQNAKRNYEKTFLGRIDNIRTKLQTKISDIFGVTRDARNVMEKASSVTLEEARTAASQVQTTQNQNESNSQQTKTLNREELQSVAKDVINGKYGNGKEREEKLKEAGYDYDTIDWFIRNTRNGNLTEAEFQSLNVPAELTRANSDGKTFKDARAVARGVLRGEYGKGADREQRLKEAGYDPAAIQWIANNLHNSNGYISEEEFAAMAKPPEVEKWLKDNGYLK